MSEQSKIDEAASFIRGEIQVRPEIGLILGSGLGVLADLIDGIYTASNSVGGSQTQV